MKGILIADAGGSKSDWVLVTSTGDITRFATTGINPALMSEDVVRSKLLKVKDNFSLFPDIHEIRFFGAGCAYPEINTRLAHLIKDIWPSASIFIESDLMGASIALFGESDGIAAILGTGSNSCLYQKGKILDNIPPLGYILGDEGGGVALGKKLLSAIFKKELPREMADKFHQEYNLTLPELIRNVYGIPNPAPFIASFAPFLSRNINNPAIYRLVRDEIYNFFLKNICKYTSYNQYSVGFIGSVAFSFKDIILEIGKEINLGIEKFLASPIEGLITFYMTKTEIKK